ncbi:unnamed protein product [Allacma fusca]|uniref:Equilibrative nucleoside transporter 1 n=1 Tax=Allacma fusca TaxID=39272 RepID=A0A8J2KBG3_9HEXA|nr:unnamed protein product [Allacma fusca]
MEGPRRTRKGTEESGRLDGEGEKQPFLGGSSSSALPTVGPVRLTPGWEDSIPNRGDDIHFRNSATNLAQPPVDRFKLVFLIMVIHGIGTLMPWNMFITAKSYFVDYKLHKNYTGVESTYANNFLPVIGFAAQIPNVLFNWLNIFVSIGGNLKTRIIWSIVIEVFLFIGTIILAMVDTRDFPGVFYSLTVFTVVVMNMAGGIYQNSVYGIAAKLDYTGAVVLGNNISGTFAAIISIISIAMAPEKRTAAIYYFITALFVLLVCFDTYFALPLNKFYRYHELQSSKEQESKRQIGARSGVTQKASYFSILKKCFPQCVNVFLVFFVTLSVFPTVISDIGMSDPNFIITEKYFTQVTCFLTFNLFAMIGNVFPSLFQWPSARFLWIPVVLRFLFVPFFLFCQYKPLSPTRTLPIYIANDWVYWGGSVLLGLTSGYYSSLAMIYCPRTVESENAPVAGMFGAAFLITGIFAGITFSSVMKDIVSIVV